MQQPTGIGRQLHGLRTRQKHAIVQGVEKSRFIKPAFFIDQDTVHQGDLTCRSTKGQDADTSKGFCRLRKGRSVGSIRKTVHSMLPLPASYAFPGGHDGTNHRVHHRGSCPFATGSDRRSPLRKARERSPEAGSLRFEVHSCRIGARWPRDVSSSPIRKSAYRRCIPRHGASSERHLCRMELHVFPPPRP